MEFEFIDIDTVNLEKIVETLDINSKISSIKIQEIKKLEEASVTKFEEKKITPSIHYDLEPPFENDKNQEFEEEIDFYLSELEKINNDEIIQKIYDILPVKKKANYVKITKRLILETIKNIKDINDFILEMRDDISKEDLVSLKEEITFENKKIELMNNYLTYEVQEEIKGQDQQNNLIFTPTTYGNIRVLEELKRIDIEYYNDFLSLLNSIKDGTFKGVKRFSNNSSLNGFVEVRLYQTRVIFQRLDNINYAIITAFVKKTQNDKFYRDKLISRINDYKAIEKDIKESLQDINYIEENKTLEEEIYSILKSHNKELKKELVK